MTTLSFPADLVVGSLTLVNRETRDRADVPAQGDVEVGDGYLAMLKVSAEGAALGAAAYAGLAPDALMMVQGGEGFGDEAAAAIAHLTGLETVVLNQAPITDAGLKSLASLTGLTQLYLITPEVADLSPLSAMTALSSVTLMCPKITDLAPLGQPSLRSLMLSGADDLGDDGIAGLAGATGIEMLALNASSLGDATAEVVGRLTSLKQLRLNGTGITDRGAAALASLTKLTSLDLSGPNKITDEGAAALASSLTSLTSLSLDSAELSDDGVAALLGLTSLTSLDLRSATSVTDAGLAGLGALTELTSLAVAGTAVGEATIAALATLPALENIALVGADDRTVLRVRQAAPKATVNGVHYTPKAVAKLTAKLGG